MALTKVYNNVEGHRMIDGGNVVEDVTSVTLPDVKHTTTTIDASGMIAAVEMPNTAHLESMEYAVSHNNGVNCKGLARPGKHSMEFRIVRQRYNVPVADIEHESVKFRIVGVHKETSKGAIETGNPYGSTDKFSVLRFEEEVNGEIVTVIDVMAGVYRHNGVDYSSAIEALLN